MHGGSSASVSCQTTGSITPGSFYKFSFYGRSTHTTGVKYTLDITYAGAGDSDQIGTNIGASGYMKFPQIIYVPAGTAAITIKITNTDAGGRDLFLDDFALIEG